MEKKIVIIPFMLLLFAVISSCEREGAHEYGVWVSVAELSELLREHEPLIVDIRTPGEFNTGHLRGAINM
ncbi:MAG: rhodanese-like domain-containing protein, partial [Desulfopila sp.]|nr:rhodanese-like domain-containing protein [Desulfopila sp.]